MKILYAEDEKQLSAAVTEFLKTDDYEVDAVYNGDDAWEKLRTGCYDAVILDIMMPGMSGTDVLKLMRENEIYTPVLLLTAKNETDDRIFGFKSGADDYLAKPFSAAELLARVAAIIRRSVSYTKKIFTIGNITLRSDVCEIESPEAALRLSNEEAKMLSFFINNRSGKFTVDDLHRKIWNESEPVEIVKLYISYIRTKLGQIHSDVNIFESNGMYYIGEL